MSSMIDYTNGTPKVALAETIRTEPSPRWVRVAFNGKIVADSRQALYVWGEDHLVTYFFPWDDVQADRLAPARRGRDGRQYYDLTVGDQLAKAAAWSYPDPNPERAPLAGYMTFKWSKMDHWYEEEEEIFVHPRDPYHRVDAVPSSRHIRVALDGVTLAESDRPVLVFETGLPVRYYLPQEDVKMAHLSPSRVESICPYKGTASYWSIQLGDRAYRHYVWGYLDPVPESPKIKGLLSFFNEKVDIFVEGELEERPQTPWS